MLVLLRADDKGEFALEGIFEGLLLLASRLDERDRTDTGDCTERLLLILLLPAPLVLFLAELFALFRALSLP